jgi:endonuclease/exonuclease/phosphatase family metal-dependent hydrolase
MTNSLRSITYNIHRCIGGDHKLSPKRISDVIAAHQSDIVALQGVDCGQVRPSLYDQAALIAEQLNFSEAWIERERCGDFNTHPGSTVFKLLEDKLINVEKLLLNGNQENTWPSNHPLLSYDHIFFSDDLVVEAVQVPADAIARMASDHLPFFVQISLPDRRQTLRRYTNEIERNKDLLEGSYA